MTGNLEFNTDATGDDYIVPIATGNPVEMHLSNGLTFQRTGGTMPVIKVEAHTMWHAGNDGTGSGLDADTLDGIQGADLMPINGVVDNYLSVRRVRNNGAGATDGMYIGYGNAGGAGALTRLYGGGSTTSNVVIDASGNLSATGDVSAMSDIRLKSNVETIDNALEKIFALRGVTFTKNEKKGIGLIAQEVAEVVPEVVNREIGSGYLTVAYGNLVGLLIEAIKEQQDQIDELRRIIGE